MADLTTVIDEQIEQELVKGVPIEDIDVDELAERVISQGGEEAAMEAARFGTSVRVRYRVRARGLRDPKTDLGTAVKEHMTHHPGTTRADAREYAERAAA